MAKAIGQEKTRMEGGIEASLETVGAACLVFAIIGAIALIVIGNSTTGNLLTGLVPAAAALFSGMVSRILLRACAELIRLQKKQAGLPFDGAISAPHEVTSIVSKCSECGSVQHVVGLKCSSCGAIFEDEPAESNPA